MKSFLLASSSILLIWVTSCTSKPDLDENRPIDLDLDVGRDKKEDYFVKQETIETKLSQSPNSTVKLVFNFSNSFISSTAHNQVQASAVAKATNSLGLIRKQFRFIIQGENITSNHEETLYKLLSYSGINPLRFEVVSTQRTTSSEILSKTISGKANETTVIMTLF